MWSMESSASAETRPFALAARRPRRLRAVHVGAALFWGIVVGNAVLIVWLWVHGGNLHPPHTGDLLNSLGRITGLLGAYLALLQVLLLARLPWVERISGFDRLTRWHRWNGHAVLYLVLAHVVFSVYGYALLDNLGKGVSIWQEIRTMLGGGIYPGMITATIGTALLVVVTLSSIVIVKKRLRYEWWYAVHLTAYASIALGWFHQVPTGNELVLDKTAAAYWNSLYVVTLVLLVVWRVLVPAANTFRFGLRVADVSPEGPDVVSVRLTGRRLQKLHARPGQFFLWRFLARDRWWTAHPFSLSAAPDGRSLRITVKALGDHTAKMGTLRPGTRVVAEGPFGVFTARAARRPTILLVAGGIGITPVRALVEELDGDVVVLYRVVSEDELIFRGELEELAAQRRDLRVVPVVGDHRGPGAALLSPAHLRQLVPDLRERDVFLCGPPAMADALERNLRGAGVRRSHIHVERFAL
jgi:predicted ferric reductase